MTTNAPALRRCASCKALKPVEDFGKDASQPGGIKTWCKPCLAARARAYRLANLEAERERDRRYREANPEKALEAQRRYREAHPEKVRAAQRRYREANPEKARETWRNTERRRRPARRVSDRAAVFAHYGAACACCNATASLQIDHVTGALSAPQGAPRSGSALYRWLVTHSFPDGFQTLCRACNRSKSDGTRCTLPH